jgi:YD repeat-containing protein
MSIVPPFPFRISYTIFMTTTTTTLKLTKGIETVTATADGRRVRVSWYRAGRLTSERLVRKSTWQWLREQAEQAGFSA